MLWPGLLALAVLLAVVVGLSGDETTPLFVEDLREQAASMSRQARGFQDALTRISSVDRVELVELTDEVVATRDEIEAFLAEHVGPEELSRALVLFELALEAWETGATRYRDALLEAADEPAAVGSEDRVIDALLDLRNGDRLYQQMVTEMARPEVPSPVSAMPEARFLPAPYPISAAAQTAVAAARSDRSPLELRAALAIQQVTTEPEWVLDTEGQLVVVETETLTVKVVIANEGNTASDPSELQLGLAGGAEVQEMTAPVEPLEPASNTAVSFEGLRVSPGSAYQVVVRLPLAEGEAESEDNARSVSFRINLPTPSTTTTTSTTEAG